MLCFLMLIRMKINLDRIGGKSSQKSTQRLKMLNLSEFWLSLRSPNLPTMNFLAATLIVPQPRRLPPSIPLALMTDLLMISSCKDNQQLNLCIIYVKLKQINFMIVQLNIFLNQEVGGSNHQIVELKKMIVIFSRLLISINLTCVDHPKIVKVWTFFVFRFFKIKEENDQIKNFLVI